jgi:hypothetical protein
MKEESCDIMGRSKQDRKVRYCKKELRMLKGLKDSQKKGETFKVVM